MYAVGGLLQVALESGNAHKDAKSDRSRSQVLTRLQLGLTSVYLGAVYSIVLETISSCENLTQTPHVVTFLEYARISCSI
jgi:hypothetical protein